MADRNAGFPLMTREVKSLDYLLDRARESDENRFSSEDKKKA